MIVTIPVTGASVSTVTTPPTAVRAEWRAKSGASHATEYCTLLIGTSTASKRSAPEKFAVKVVVGVSERTERVADVEATPIMGCASVPVTVTSCTVLNSPIAWTPA